MRLSFLALTLSCATVAADTEIHRCTQADGTVAFQEKPCADIVEVADEATETAEPVVEDEFFNFVNPFDEPAEPAEAHDSTLPEPISADRAECEKTTRDAIDAIDRDLAEKLLRDDSEYVRAWTVQLAAESREANEFAPLLSPFGVGPRYG